MINPPIYTPARGCHLRAGFTSSPHCVGHGVIEDVTVVGSDVDAAGCPAAQLHGGSAGVLMQV
jgi:hypothetical protein